MHQQFPLEVTVSKSCYFLLVPGLDSLLYNHLLSSLKRGKVAITSETLFEGYNNPKFVIISGIV